MDDLDGAVGAKAWAPAAKRRAAAAVFIDSKCLVEEKFYERTMATLTQHSSTFISSVLRSIDRPGGARRRSLAISPGMRLEGSIYD